MPWTIKQHRMFCAAANDGKLAKKMGLSRDEARKMCREGVKKTLLKKRMK